MLLLYILGIVTVLCIVFIYSSLRTRFSRSTKGEAAAHCLQLINQCVSRLPLPIILRVYIVGAAETLITVIYKRGYFGHPSKIDTYKVIDRLVALGKVSQARTAVVTGGDSGIGFEIVTSLLQAGYNVILASRTEEAAKESQASLEMLTGTTGKITFTCLDLCSFASVRSWVDQIKTRYPKGKFDILINNAGVMNTPYRMTEDGFESQIQTNYLSPLMLTVMLCPWMKKTGKILFAASSTTYCVNEINPVMFRQTYRYDGLAPYAHSKLCVAHGVRALQKRLESLHSKISVHCYHPGTVRTKLFSHTTLFNLPFFSYLLDAIMLTPKEGSLTALYLCLCSDPIDGGHYWADTVPHAIPDVRVKGQGYSSSVAVLDNFFEKSLAQCRIEATSINVLLNGEDVVQSLVL